MAVMTALVSGLAGACALTLAHETLRRAVPDAPRADVLGERAVAGAARAFGAEPPAGLDLFEVTLGADIVANAAYYALAGAGDPDGAVLRGAALGALAGVGGVLLPEPLGLGAAPTARSAETMALTVALYAFGGIVAGATYRALARRSKRRALVRRAAQAA